MASTIISIALLINDTNNIISAGIPITPADPI
jgi:hypothetical protein